MSEVDSFEKTTGYLVRRAVHDALLTALKDTRVVVLLGARQVGKSTLTRYVAAHDVPMSLVSLDDVTTRAAAVDDPAGILAEAGRPLLIDEAQRAPDLLLEIKDIVDQDREPGRFLLTGSANILTAPKLREALTGRAEYLTLWPFSQSELSGCRTNFVDRLLARDIPAIANAPVGRSAFVDIVAAGGYPEARLRPPDRRRRWYRDYIDSLVERDLRDIADAKRLDVVPRLLRLIAARAANLFVPSNVAGELRIDDETVVSYTKLLETIFVVKRIQAWRPGIGSREIQHEKIYVVDSGLMAYLLGAGEERIARDDQITGKILENFVAMEVLRLSETSEAEPRQYHYRQHKGRYEVDIVLETLAGGIAGIEVKAAATVKPDDYGGLAKLRDARGSSFVAGVVLYTGASTKPLGDRLWAVPLSALWID
jgi:predicted AAA+ superfamily ATPase